MITITITNSMIPIINIITITIINMINNRIIIIIISITTVRQVASGPPRNTATLGRRSCQAGPISFFPLSAISCLLLLLRVCSVYVSFSI